MTTSVKLAAAFLLFLVPFAASAASDGNAPNLRYQATRIHSPGIITNRARLIFAPQIDKLLNELAKKPISALKEVLTIKAAENEVAEPEQNDNAIPNDTSAEKETLESIFGDNLIVMSMATTAQPSRSPVVESSDSPSVPPSHSPSVSHKPSTGNTTVGPTVEATSTPTSNPTAGPTVAVTTTSPTTSPPTASPTTPPTASPTTSPTASPTTSPSSSPTQGASDQGLVDVPTVAPTFQHCGMSSAEREARILAILDAAADPNLIRNSGVPQGQATEWILSLDDRTMCPDDPKILQRWALAVIYFSTGGDEWDQCSGNPAASDQCGQEEPFFGDRRFLSTFNECEWAGISCVDGCVTVIEFEDNSLIGTIPSEIALLEELTIWGMERGGLTSTIPTEVGLMRNLVFIDMDFNSLTGSLSSELLSLSSLTQLDLNDNQLTGSIEGIGGFPEMEFMQLHGNNFFGTVPDAVGNYQYLAAFTLHRTEISGVMPQSVCDLLLTENKGGVLGSLIADCSQPNPDIQCDCCTDCRDT